MAVVKNQKMLINNFRGRLKSHINESIKTNMNYKKRITTIFSIAFSVFCLASTNVFAAPCGVSKDQVPISLEQQMEDVLNDPTMDYEKKQLMIEKLDHLMAIQSGEYENTRSSIPSSLTLTVQFHRQQNDYYCGPATVQQTYEYLYFMKYGRYYSPTQSYIAGQMKTTDKYGTDMSEMTKFLNNSSLNCSYAELWVWNNSQSTYDQYVSDSIASKMPVMLNISVPGTYATRSSPTDKTKWLFKTPGHYLNISGYNFTNSSKKYYEATDPYSDRFGSEYASGKYDVNNDVVMLCTNALMI